MITTKTACEVIRKLPEISEKDHFGGDAFYAHKRIIATVWHEENKVNIRLTPDLQRKFLETDGESFCEIDNAWGRQGWTTVQLEFIDKGVFSEAIQSAWDVSKNNSAPKKSSKTKPTATTAKAKKKVRKRS